MALVRVPIEVDITFTNKTWYSGHVRKDPSRHYVIGFFQRHGNCIIRVLKDNKPETIIDALLKGVQTGAMVYCEENILPPAANDLYEIHELKTSERETVNGDVHINNIKNAWKDLRRLIKTVHIQVSKKHLQLYCDQVSFHINTRNLSPMDKFNLALSNCERPKKRSYQDLIK